jgi:hypothetical protein
MLTAFLMRWYRSSGSSGATPAPQRTRQQTRSARARADNQPAQPHRRAPRTVGGEDAENLAARDGGHLRNAHRVSELHADLRRRQALLGKAQNLLLHRGGVDLAPRGRGALPGPRRTRDTLAAGGQRVRAGASALLSPKRTHAAAQQAQASAAPSRRGGRARWQRRQPKARRDATRVHARHPRSPRRVHATHLGEKRRRCARSLRSGNGGASCIWARV